MYFVFSDQNSEYVRVTFQYHPLVCRRLDMCAFRCPICSGRTDHLPVEEYCSTGTSVDQIIQVIKQKNENLQSKITTLISMTNDSQFKMELQNLLQECLTSRIDISQLHKTFQKIVEDYETKLKQSEKHSKSLRSKYEKTKVSTQNQMQNQATNAKELSDDIQRLNKLLQDSQNAYQDKCSECDKLKTKLEKTKKKARQVVHHQSNKIQSDNEEIVSRLHKQIDDLNTKLQELIHDKEFAETTINDTQRQLVQKDAEIEDLKKLLQEANECKHKQNLFQEIPFDFQNPFKGDLSQKFEKIKNMTQFESHQRVQLILNEASRELQISEKANEQLTSDLKEAQNNYNELLESNSETKTTLHTLLAQLQQLEKNEMLLGDYGLRKDQTWVNYIGSVLPKEIPVADVDSLVSRLSQTDKVAASLVSSLLLANTKQHEQQQRLLNEIKQRDEVIEPIKQAGIPPEEVLNLITALKEKKSEYKKEVKSLQKEITKLNQSIGAYEQENEKMNQSIELLQNDLTVSHDHLDLTTNQKAQIEGNLQDVQSKYKQVQKERDELAKQLETLQTEKNAVDEELKKVQNELASKTQAYAKLDVQFRMAKKAVKEKFIQNQEKERLAEEEARKKLEYLQKKHTEQILEAKKQANAIKESSYKALDASYSQASDLKGMLREVLIKLEKLKADKTSLISENEQLRKQNHALRKHANQAALANNEEKENYKQTIEHYELTDRTHKSITAKEITASALREKQRIMNIVARELGSPYNIEYFEADDENSFIMFIRRIRDDLKKLKIFQNNELNQKK